MPISEERPIYSFFFANNLSYKKSCGNGSYFSSIFMLDDCNNIKDKSKYENVKQKCQIPLCRQSLVLHNDQDLKEVINYHHHSFYSS